jgi:hypothetical protein
MDKLELTLKNIIEPIGQAITNLMVGILDMISFSVEGLIHFFDTHPYTSGMLMVVMWILFFIFILLFGTVPISEEDKKIYIKKKLRGCKK